MPTPATAGDDDDFAVFRDGADDDVDDSEEEEEDVEDESDEEEEEDEEEQQCGPLPRKATVTAPTEDLNFSSPSTSTSSDRAPNSNPNNSPANPTKQPSPSRNGVAVIHVSPISAAAPTSAVDDLVTASPDRKRQKTETAETVSEEKKPLALLEDSRRLFQRLWTDEDEIAILQGFLEFTSQRSAATAHHSHHHDTGPFYDQIKTHLQLEFNKNQLVEKLRRLKKKYRNVMNKIDSGKEYAFKSPHDQATFELSRKIWSNSIYSRAADDDEEDEPNPHINHGNDLGVNSGTRTPRMSRRGRKRSVAEAAEAAMLAPEAPVEVKVAESHMPTAMASVPNLIEETVRSCLSPLFKELLYCAVGGSVGPPGLGGESEGLGLSLLPLTIGGNPVNLPSSGTMAPVDAKWRKQQILELEIYSKRLELVQEQIKLTVGELHSMG